MSKKDFIALADFIRDSSDAHFTRAQIEALADYYAEESDTLYHPLNPS